MATSKKDARELCLERVFPIVLRERMDRQKARRKQGSKEDDCAANLV